jgi:hypothetical protein
MRASDPSVPTYHLFMGSECLCVCIFQSSLGETYALYKLLFLCEMFKFKLFCHCRNPCTLISVLFAVKLIGRVTLKSRSWLRRTPIYLRSACGSRIRYSLDWRKAHTLHCHVPVLMTVYTTAFQSVNIYWLLCQYTVSIAVNFSFPPMFWRLAVLLLDPHITIKLGFNLILTYMLVREGCRW